MNHRTKGFTLIELLIVIAIIAIIAAVAFVALDPLTRFQDARDSSRWADLAALTSAITIDQVDNGGSYLSEIATTTAGQVYMIGTAGSGCTAQNANCDTKVDQAACVDLTGLVNEGYLGEVPVSPSSGAVTWDSTLTGYTLERSATGTITIRACESENSTEISLVR